MAYTSTGTGTSWLPTGPLGSASAASVSGATVAPGGTVVAIGATAASKISQQPVFLEAGTDGTVRSVSLAGIAGATVPEMKINSTAVAGGLQIAVGSANGYPAVWRRTSGGAWTLVSSLGLVAADPHLRALTSVTHGPSGWLAVGAPGPVVLTSADGEIWGVAGGNITQNLAGVSAVAATSGPAGYVIVGRLVAAGGSCVADVWWSPDMTSWTRAHDVNDTDGSSQVLAVAAGAHGFVSVGSHNSQPAVWTTTNGRAWKTIVLPAAGRGLGRSAPAGRDQRQPRGRPGPGHDRGRSRGRLGDRHRAGYRAVRRAVDRRRGDLAADPVQLAGTLYLVHRADRERDRLHRRGPVRPARPAGRGAVGVGDRRELEAVPVRRPQRIRSLADRRDDPVGAQVAGIGTILTQQSQQTVTFTLPPR